jgi:hypothetical protein
MDNTAPLNIGRLSVEIPADCPDRSVFENVVRYELESKFGGDAGRAAFAKSEFDRCMDVPEPFVRNVDAADHYRDAQLAMSPAGQQWQMFKDSLQAHFLDRHPTMAPPRNRQFPVGNRRGKSTLQCARPPGCRKPNATPGRNGSVEDAALRPCA